MRMRHRWGALLAAAAAVATLPGTASYATVSDEPPTLVAASTLADQPVHSFVQASAWQPVEHGWRSRFRVVTVPQERTVIHVRWRSPTFLLRPGESAFTTREQYSSQGAPDARLAMSDSFRICFPKSGTCTPWWVGGAAGSPFPSGLITYDETGWDRSPWTGPTAKAYFQWRLIWRQDNADRSDVTLRVQL